MFTYIRYGITGILGVVLTYFLVISTLNISLTSADKIIDKKAKNVVTFSMASIAPNGEIQLKSLEAQSGKTNFPAEKDFPKDKAVQISFGRLSSAFVLPAFGKSVSEFKNSIKKTNDSTIEIGDTPSIFSFYDPFQNYTIRDTKNRFTFEAITNGSIYVGQESDGMISVYSIDSIGEMTFLADGKKMTDIILFPGMFIRFDPTQNSELKNADITQIMQVLQGKKGNMGTGIEFTDVRLMRSDGSATFFLSRLPRNTKILFKMLQKSFQDRVKKVALLEKYADDNAEFNPNNDNAKLINPTKKMHHVLGELRFILSKAVTNKDIDMKKFRSQYDTILEKAKLLKSGNTIEEIMEQFLIDGRFALFLQKNKLQYQTIYNVAAEIVGVAPTSGKSRLFAVLSGIFSENLIQQDTSLTGIHTYLQAVKELSKMLASEMDKKDYLDLSLYAFSIFGKITDKHEYISREALDDEEGVVFQLYLTVLKATQKYAENLENFGKQNAIQKEFVNKFYANMIHRLRISIYGNYVVVKDGKLYLRDEIVDRDIVKVSMAFRTYVTEITNLMENIYANQLEQAFENADSRALSELENLKQDIFYLKGFLFMIQRNAYKGYLQDPYIAVNSKTPLPKIENNMIIRLSQQETQEKENTDENINENEDFSSESESTDNSIEAKKSETENEILHSNNGNTKTVDGIEISFAKEEGTYTQLSFLVKGNKVDVIGQFNTPELEIFTMDLAAYKAKISDIISRQDNTPNSIRIIAPQRMILIDGNSFYLQNQ